MVFRAITHTDFEAEKIAQTNNLQKWQSERYIRYEAQEEAKLKGYRVSIVKNKITVSCSLHKYHNKKETGILENDGLFTLTQARQSLYDLLSEIGLEPEKVKVSYFEIGLNLQLSSDPLSYIQEMEHIVPFSRFSNKQFYIDANYKENRQTTTEKHKNIKKYFKIYDKGFEQEDRKRLEHRPHVKILRIETVYLRQYIPVNDFLSKKHLLKVTDTFYRDWANVGFKKVISADAGVNIIQKKNAQDIIFNGIESFVKSSKSELDKGLITAKQFRVKREFARDWSKISHKFSIVESLPAKEFKTVLRQQFKSAQKGSS